MKPTPTKIGLAAGLMGYFLAAGVMAASIFRSTSSTAAIGCLFVPLVALVPAVPFFVLGFCAGFFAQARGATERRRRIAAWVSLGIAVVVVLTGAVYLVDNLLTVYQVRECLQMDGGELEAFFRDGARNRNKFVLGAIAQNPAAGADLLDAISALDDPELHEGMGSVFPLLGENRSGLAVMRLVARHANVGTRTLERLAESPDDYVLGDVVMNPKTPVEILREAHRNGGYLVEWGLAANPETPGEILSEIAASDNEYTRSSVAKNPGTPIGGLTKLARDPVWHVRRSVVYHPGVPDALLEELARDADERVRAAAQGVRSRR